MSLRVGSSVTGVNGDTWGRSKLEKEGGSWKQESRSSRIRVILITKKVTKTLWKYLMGGGGVEGRRVVYAYNQVSVITKLSTLSSRIISWISPAFWRRDWALKYSTFLTLDSLGMRSWTCKPAHWPESAWPNGCPLHRWNSEKEMARQQHRQQTVRSDWPLTSFSTIDEWDHLL